MTQTCVGKITNIGSDNGLSPGRRQAINWTNAGTLLIGPLGTNFNETIIEINTFSFKEMHLKMSSAKWRLFPLGLNELKCFATGTSICNYLLSSFIADTKCSSEDSYFVSIGCLLLDLIYCLLNLHVRSQKYGILSYILIQRQQS